MSGPGGVDAAVLDPSLVRALYPALYTWALLAARVAPLVFLVPAFGGLRLVASVRASVVMVLVLALWPATVVVAPATLAVAVPAFAAQLLLGLVAGTLVVVFAEGARSVGALSDVALGRGSMGAGDPLASGPGGPLATLYALLWTVGFVGSGAHLLLLEAFALGLDVIPLGAPLPVGFTVEAAGAVVDALTASFALAVAFALPAFTLAWLVDLTLGWLGRALPQLQAMFVAMPVRAVLGWFVVAVSVAAVTSTFVALALDAAGP